MSTPITWRNVNGPSPAEAMRPLLGAQQSFNASFDQLGQILNRTEQVGNNNVAVANEVAKQQYLTLLDSAKTPEELAALQQTDQFKSAFVGLNAAAQGQVRTADDARLSALRQQTSQAGQYSDEQQSRGERAIRDQIATLTARGDVAGARALADANPTLLNRGAIEGGIALTEQQAADRLIKQRQFGLQVNQDARAAAAEGRAAGAYPGQQALASAQLGEVQAKAAEAAQLRGVDTLIQTQAAEHQNTVSKNTDLISKAALDMGGIPMKDGRPNFNAMNSKELENFDDYLKKNNLPTTSTITSQDTAAGSKTIDLIRQQYGPAGVARATQLVPQAFDTSGIAKIGKDADRATFNSTKYDQEQAELASRYGGISTETNAAKLMKAADSAIETIAKGRGEEGKIADYRDALTKKLAEGGIKTKDGRRILPSEDALYQIVRSIDSSWRKSATTEFNEAFDRWAQNPDNIKGAEELFGTKQRADARKLDESTEKKRK